MLLGPWAAGLVPDHDWRGWSLGEGPFKDLCGQRPECLLRASRPAGLLVAVAGRGLELCNGTISGSLRWQMEVPPMEDQPLRTAGRLADCGYRKLETPFGNFRIWECRQGFLLPGACAGGLAHSSELEGK